MKRFLFLIVLLAGATGILAQQATINAPVADSAYKVVEYTILKQKVIVELRVTDAGDNSKRVLTVVDNDTQAFLQAFDTAVAGEAGGIIRKREARVLQRLLDAGLLPGVTIVP